MSGRHICDCGQVYSNLDALLACQNARHSASLANELADAEAFARECGVEEPDTYLADDELHAEPEERVDPQTGTLE